MRYLQPHPLQIDRLANYSKLEDLISDYKLLFDDASIDLTEQIADDLNSLLSKGEEKLLHELLFDITATMNHLNRLQMILNIILHPDQEET